MGSGVGDEDGVCDGNAEGGIVGSDDGDEEGVFDGNAEGASVVGVRVGRRVGTTVGGTIVGGSVVGFIVGFPVKLSQWSPKKFDWQLQRVPAWGSPSSRSQLPPFSQALSVARAKTRFLNCPFSVGLQW